MRDDKEESTMYSLGLAALALAIYAIVVPVHVGEQPEWLAANESDPGGALDVVAVNLPASENASQ